MSDSGYEYVWSCDAFEVQAVISLERVIYSYIKTLASLVV
jgi:hypothetical protein